MKTALIIGGGLGGLFCGAILSKEGMGVTIVEKNATLGGGLQSFSRFGETFDTGMHVIGGMHQGGNVRRICDYLGVLNEMKIREVDERCTDALYFAEDKMWYRVARGRDGFINSLSEHFPAERDNIGRYVDAVFAIADSIDLFNLRPSTLGMNMYSGDFLLPANEFVNKYVQDRKLRSVLAYMNPLYSGMENRTPAYIHAIISTLYIHGSHRFVGGSGRFADTLENLIKRQGGNTITADAVEWVEVNDRHVDFVRTHKGVELKADYYISDIHPCSLLSMMDETALPRSYRNRLESIPNSYSAFSLYIKMKEGGFPYINHSEYYMTRYDEIWNCGKSDRPWPLGFLFMTPPEEDQGEYSRKVLVTAPMLFKETSPWIDTKTGHRGRDYELWKREKTDQLLDHVEVMHPGFREAVENINSSSPLTIRDFYAAKEGGMSGFSKDCNNIALSQVPVVTKIDNLYLTGQNNSLHGFCGVPLTAISTSEAILGRNHVLNKISAL